ncbi:hypothetical protein BDZ90DRAFT_261295 [Jaminaea rosea]|uniref:Endonuclease/exonuclease/phosphatase domain-containing protein n=1 Tax=Jaminaea rosea TaxID=1569628 RepID=A0A316UMG5_9BASI|nr:hypothetical protein BDZ90DRAFT_261295 [Jaminaea rosea]PWN26482.1 hypothetical protein BDZ90DRAFT_261295 [Jaminaea rosea]
MPSICHASICHASISMISHRAHHPWRRAPLRDDAAHGYPSAICLRGAFVAGKSKKCPLSAARLTRPPWQHSASRPGTPLRSRNNVVGENLLTCATESDILFIQEARMKPVRRLDARKPREDRYGTLERRDFSGVLDWVCGVLFQPANHQQARISVHYPHNLSQTPGWQGNSNHLSRIQDTAGSAIIIGADWNMPPSRHLESVDLGGWTSDGNVTGRRMTAVGYRPQQQATDTVQRWVELHQRVGHLAYFAKLPVGAAHKRAADEVQALQARVSQLKLARDDKLREPRRLVPQILNAETAFYDRTVMKLNSRQRKVLHK